MFVTEVCAPTSGSQVIFFQIGVLHQVVAQLMFTTEPNLTEHIFSRKKQNKKNQTKIQMLLIMHFTSGSIFIRPFSKTT